MYNTIVIGGGPAGMMAALTVAKANKQVILLEKNDRLGKKLYITGKGRCNITNDSDVENHLKQVTTNAKFLYSAFYTFDSRQVIQFFNNQGLATKTERGQRVFPESDKSSDVIKVLEDSMLTYGVEVRLKTEVLDLLVEDQCVKGVVTTLGNIYSQNVIIATGGISYSMTGSTGDGYKFAKAYGHQLVQPIQGLVPLDTIDTDILELQGLALKNVKLSLFDYSKKPEKPKLLYSELGEMLFTHFGISGPLVLTASSYLPRETSLSKIKLYIDLKPGLSEEVLDKRIVRDFEKYHRKALKNGLVDLLPQSMISIVLHRANLNPEQIIDQVSKEQRSELLRVLKYFEIRIKGLRRFNEAIITRGGVSLKDINPSTMESKKVKQLFFVGEVLDLDAMTGGYNLQIAFSTAYLAGLTISETKD
jgi:predicted Rossmann fold flavoprotein